MFAAEVSDPIMTAMLTVTAMLLVAGIGGIVRLAMIVASIKTTQDDHGRRLTEMERRIFHDQA